MKAPDLEQNLRELRITVAFPWLGCLGHIGSRAVKEQRIAAASTLASETQPKNRGARMRGALWHLSRVIDRVFSSIWVGIGRKRKQPRGLLLFVSSNSSCSTVVLVIMMMMVILILVLIILIAHGFLNAVTDTFAIRIPNPSSYVYMCVSLCFFDLSRKQDPKRRKERKPHNTLLLFPPKQSEAPFSVPLGDSITSGLPPR